MRPLKVLEKIRRHKLKMILTLSLVYVIGSWWPVLGLGVGLMSHKPNLIIFINENEARPCGGFATAFASLRTLPPGLDMGSTYQLNGTLGPIVVPLDKVASNLHFWDLGTSMEAETCAQDFGAGYERLTGISVHKTILFNAQVIEDWMDDATFFARTSRAVADVDRHDEGALAGRKEVLREEAKNLLILRTLNVFGWPDFARDIRSAVETGEIYIPETSPNLSIESDDFAVVEWNLGGAKSSRYLDKKLHVSTHQNRAGAWKIDVGFVAEHLGSYDEPLSQDWQGEFELYFPAFMEVPPQRFEAVIAPGGVFEKTTSLVVEDLPGFGLFVPRGQELFAEVQVQAFGQNQLRSESLKVRENSGVLRTDLRGERLDIDLEVLPDKTAPFLTLHTVVQPDLSDEILATYFIENPDLNYFYAEVHFNEPIYLSSDFQVQIADRDHSVPGLSENPIGTSHFLKDPRTLLLQFSQTQFQKDERFYLTLSGVADFFDNEIEPVKRTVITR